MLCKKCKGKCKQMQRFSLIQKLFVSPRHSPKRVKPHANFTEKHPWRQKTNSASHANSSKTCIAQTHAQEKKREDSKVATRVGNTGQTTVMNRSELHARLERSRNGKQKLDEIVKMCQAFARCILSFRWVHFKGLMRQSEKDEGRKLTYTSSCFR